MISWLDIVQSLLTTFAIIVGGFWTWKLYRQKRQRYPRANVDHSVTCISLPDQRRILRLKVTVHNIGDVLIELSQGRAWVQQLAPATPEVIDAIENMNFEVSNRPEIEWPIIGKERIWSGDPYEIEPHEHADIHIDFLVLTQAEMVNIYSFFENKAKSSVMGIPTREIGWRTETIHNLSDCYEA